MSTNSYFSFGIYNSVIISRSKLGNCVYHVKVKGQSFINLQALFSTWLGFYVES